jgi:hypothetical protein
VSRYFHTSKPWVEISPAALQALSAKVHQTAPAPPGNFTGDPGLAAGLLTTSTDVRAVGAGSVNGVPVTEYAGTYSAANGTAYIKDALDSAYSAQAGQRATAMGLAVVQFKVWLDHQQRPLKFVLIEAGSHQNVIVTQTIVSINQPANIQFPPLAQTYVVPGTS